MSLSCTRSTSSFVSRVLAQSPSIDRQQQWQEQQQPPPPLAVVPIAAVDYCLHGGTGVMKAGFSSPPSESHLRSEKKIREDLYTQHEEAAAHVLFLIQ